MKKDKTNCIHYENGCDRGKIDLIPCIGVKCGYFKDKTTPEPQQIAVTMTTDQVSTVGDVLRQSIEFLREQLRNERDVYWQALKIGLLTHQRNILRSLNNERRAA